MTNNTINPADDTARRQNADLAALTTRTRAQFDRGLLTFDEFMTALVEARNEYFDDPEKGRMILMLDCDLDD
jgi:hypothetical protein